MNMQSPEKIGSAKILANVDEECQMRDDAAVCDEADNDSTSAKSTTDRSEKEIERRRKIGLANKGREPWNKGRTHSEEARARISKRTIEALSDPKVRKKMSEFPRSHSDQSKARLSSVLRKIWAERLRRRRIQEKCYLAWARSIAEAAMEGSHGQEALDWDSYERLKSDITFQYLQQKAERTRAKEITKIRAEETAKIRAENAAKRAQLRKKKEEKAKAKALARKKSEDMKTKMALSKGLKLKAKLTKVPLRKRNLGSSSSIKGEAVVEPWPMVDNLDINLIKSQKMRRQISLADQIQAVKNRKGELNSNDFPASILTIMSSEVEVGDA